ncbi:hypothetical protein HanRHA438_Chr10g0461321 [Helianthus annuus]|nr:hypothetical protein HanRHA438_Chr10g0461321 [Helianthus annuus]
MILKWGYFNTLSKESDHTDTGTTTLCFLLRTIIKNPPPSLLLASLLLQPPAFSSGYPPPLDLNPSKPTTYVCVMVCGGVWIRGIA